MWKREDIAPLGEPGCQAADLVHLEEDAAAATPLGAGL